MMLASAIRPAGGGPRCSLAHPTPDLPARPAPPPLLVGLAGGMPCCSMAHATPNVPADPALPPWMMVLVVGYFALAYWIAALVDGRPLVSRAAPVDVVLGLCGSGVIDPAYTSWLQ